MAIGAIAAIEAAGKKPGKDILVVSIDGEKDGLQAIIDGKMGATVECNPRFGPTAFATAIAYAKGEKIPPVMTNVDRFYDASNAAASIADCVLSASDASLTSRVRPPLDESRRRADLLLSCAHALMTAAAPGETRAVQATAASDELTAAAVDARRSTRRSAAYPRLSSASLEVAPGEVHALVGQNGAGKSTMIKILTGAYRRDAGEIAFDGRADRIRARRRRRSAAASARSIQEINLVPFRSVTENIFLGREQRRFGLLDWGRDERARRAGLLRRFNDRHRRAPAADGLLHRDPADGRHRPRGVVRGASSSSWTSRPPRSTSARSRCCST